MARDRITVVLAAAAVLVAAAVATSPGIGGAGAVLDAPSAPPARYGPQLRSILRRMQAHFDSTRSFTADFTETLEPVGAMKRVRSGTLAYRKGGRMRWEFADKETIVSDGATVYSYQPDLNQVIETPVSRMIDSSSATAFLLGSGSIERDFTAALPTVKPADGMVHVVLTPKRGGNRIALTLAPKTYNLLGLRMNDAVGDVTTLVFTNVRNDVALAESMFAFKVPAGADIVTGQGLP